MANTANTTEKMVYVKALKTLTKATDGIDVEAKKLAKVPKSFGEKLVKNKKAIKYLWD